MAAESGRESYVRVGREVQATDHVYDFIELIRNYSDMAFPARREEHYNTAITLDDLKKQGAVPDLAPLKITGVKFHEADNLRVTYYERRLPRSQRSNSNILRWFNRLSVLSREVLLGEGSEGVLHADCHYVLDSTSREGFNDRHRREFSAVIKDGSTLWQLHDEDRSVQRAVQSLSRESSQTALRVIDTTPSSIDEAGIVPLFTVPTRTNGAAVDALLERINLDGIAKPLVSVNFQSAEIDCKIR